MSIRPIKLQFFSVIPVLPFSKLCKDFEIEYEVTEEKDGMIRVETDPVDETRRSSFMKRWRDICHT